MLIYAERITPRLRYITGIIFGDVQFTTSPTDFIEATGPRINYSHKKFSDEALHISPVSLLSEDDIRQQPIRCFSWRGLKVFYAASGDIPFDIFSASFYLLSRYEEYLPHKKDSYGRYAHEESLAFKEGFLHLPLVDLWLRQFHELVEQVFQEYRRPGRQFTFTPTYDIDIAYAVKGRGLLRRVAAFLRNRSSGEKDIFDVYDWLDALHETSALSPAYFFLVARRRSKYDKNLSPGSTVLGKLIRRISKRYTTGLHPSWQSFHDAACLQWELERLQQISHQHIYRSRQHYIQFVLPHTYRCLIEAGITEDYSMGYGSINGFRASFSHPFHWYDLMKEETTSLLLHPFCYMEANSVFEQHYSAEEAMQELQAYYDTVKEVDGNLITIFHNHFLTETPEWQPWRQMYEGFLAENFRLKQVTSPSPQPQL